LTFPKSGYIMVDMENYIYDYSYTTRNCDYDGADRLKLSAVLACMQEASSIAVEKMGATREILRPREWGFVVTCHYLKFLKNVPVYTPVNIRTRAFPSKRVILERDFEMTDEKGEKIAEAVSRWVLMDIKNRKVLPVLALWKEEDMNYTLEKKVDFSSWKITENLSPDDCDGEVLREIRCSAYDSNRHVNNTFYADYCMDCFSAEEWSTREPDSFQICYAEQCFEYEKVLFRRRKLSEKSYLLTGEKEDGSLAVKAKLIFK